MSIAHAEDVRRPVHDPREVRGLVGLQAMLDAEAVAQRRREQARTGRGADERERREVERDDARARALADRDREPGVLHRGIEGLLERAVQAVDLVDEEDRARLQRREQRGDVALALERGPRRHHERRVELLGDDLRERCLPQPGRAGEQHVVERLAACGGRLERHGELLAQGVLTDEVLEGPRPQRAVDLVLAGERAGGLDARGGGVVHLSAARPSARSGAVPRGSRPRRRRAARRPRRAGSRARAGRRGPGAAGRRRG